MSMTSVFASDAPFSDTIATVERHVAPALAGPAARARLHAVTATIPTSLSSWWYMECRLAGGADQVDLIFDLDPAACLRVAREDGGVPHRAAAEPLWQRVREVARRWLDRDGVLGRGASSLWLEYDVEHGPARYAERVPAPGVFVSLAKVAPGPATVDAWCAVAAEALDALLGGPPSPALLRRLREAFLAAPAGTYVPYIGVMLSRAEPAVRVCYAPVDEAGTLALLDRIGWPGDRAMLEALLHRVRHRDGQPVHAGPQVLHVDIAEGTLPRIGLEYMLERRAQLRGRLGERSFLHHLVELGMADADKAAGLHRWPGAAFTALAHAPHHNLLVRRVNHLKLVQRADGDAEIKAYLHWHHRHVERESPAAA